MLGGNRKFAAKSLLCVAGLMLSGSSAYAHTLTQSVKHAIKTNPEVQLSVANRFAVGERLKQAKAGYLPVVELNAGIGRERTFNPTSQSIGSFSGRRTLTRREASASITENIFNGFGTTSNVTRERSHLHSAAHKISEKTQDIALETVERHMDVLRAQNMLMLARHNLRQHQTILNMIEKRSASGLSRKADLDQARGRLALAQANVVAEMGHLADARTAYSRVTGMEAHDLRWPRSPRSAALPRSCPQAIKLAHRNHPAVKSITADVHAAEAQHRLAISELFPKLDVVASASRNVDLDGIKGPNQDEMIMLRASYVLYKGGEHMAKRRETAYQIQEANEVRNRVLADADEHVRLTFNGLRAVTNRIGYLTQHRKLAKDTVVAYNKQFKIGKRTLLDLLDAENEHYRSSSEYYNALHDEVIARYRLLHAVGSLMDYLGIAQLAEAHVPEVSLLDAL